MSLEKNVDGLIAKHDLKMGILRLEIDNQKSKNAIKTSAFKAMTKIFRQAGVEKDVRLVYLTGKGDNYYSSGKDLSDVLEDGDPFQKLDDGMEIWRDFVDSLIDCERLVVVGVNGPVVGAACTTLALADLVYCSSKATFWTPFTKMGLVAEGCSTYTFPRYIFFGKFGILSFYLVIQADGAIKGHGSAVHEQETNGERSFGKKFGS